ncbi:hypothetical protein Hbl1158_11730 [Halobaculum sp. CBA1158]|uniref:hypothetical protein n=1 Tax=Halobaculum sp. CBA1158 TaxID=2904243 RepID=UPI001F450B55|nr:hypothetical protein [Halobaculum sp. CBA1158]UIO99197.1 hypothetical protein Hbl1158_11730 [Halobaculum sp. CBA1158]
MSSETDDGGESVPSPLAVAVEATGRTRRALSAALGDRVAVAVGVASAVLYVLAYLVAAGDLGGSRSAVAGGDTPAVDVTLAAAPLSRTLSGEAVALVTVGPVETLLAPATLSVAGALGGLVGANLALSALAWRRPRVCSVSPASGVAAGVPALLSGTACCGPLVFIVLGLQASSAALTAVAWLRPVAAALLVISLLWAAWRLDVQSPSSSGKMLSGM